LPPSHPEKASDSGGTSIVLSPRPTA